MINGSCEAPGLYGPPIYMEVGTCQNNPYDALATYSYMQLHGTAL